MKELLDAISDRIELAWTAVVGFTGTVFAAGKFTEKFQSRQKFMPRAECEHLCGAINTRFDAVDIQLKTLSSSMKKVVTHIDEVKKKNANSPADDATGF